MSSKSILVCGGAGYIGAHMCKLLADNGHRVTVFDNLSTGHADAVRWGSFIKGDLLVPADLERAFLAGPYNAVMHFSAKSIVPESVIRPDLYYLNNVVGTLNLLDAMVRYNVLNIIFSSSAAVYGTPSYTPIDEEHPTRPINPYGKSKLMVEQVLADYEKPFGLRSVSLRYFNAAGADASGLIGELHKPETHLIPNVLNSLLTDRSQLVQIFGDTYSTHDGTCIRDYVHVTDLCDAHIRSLEYLLNGAPSATFNLGNGAGFSVLEVIRAAERVTGRSARYAVTTPRPGDPPVLVAEAEKARTVLGWVPHYTDLHEIITTAWNWHNRSV